LMRLTNKQAWLTQEAVMKKALAVLGPKRRDYSGAGNPFDNFYKSEFFGVPAWKGALIRLSDKLSRIDQLAQKAGVGEVKDESLVDTVADAVNYACIILGLVIESLPDDMAARRLVAELCAYAEEYPWPTLFGGYPVEEPTPQQPRPVDGLTALSATTDGHRT